MEKVLIFIPYQDSDNFLSDGILTREFAMLYIFWSTGYKKIVNIKKPRTLLDKKRFKINSNFFPVGTVESIVKDVLFESENIQYLPKFNLNQLINRRGWWCKGYDKTIQYLDLIESAEYLVYSNNPFAVNLLKSLNEKGCRIYFDIMDNFAIHPSLNVKERRVALNGYKAILKFADCISANSDQTCTFMKKYTKKDILLIKNGVFDKNEVLSVLDINEIQTIRKKKASFKTCAGYIGKLGLRLDEDLIDNISKNCPETLFVFVGGYLKGQINKKLIKLFENRKNILHIGAIPSAYVYPILNEFDILIIPHSVGKNENGGDPLKLYQYMTREKPVITTRILGVDEFEDTICISNELKDWISFINNDYLYYHKGGKTDFTWDSRVLPLLYKLGIKENNT